MCELEEAWKSLVGVGDNRYARGKVLKQIAADGGDDPLCSVGASSLPCLIELARLVDEGVLKDVNDRVSFVRRADADLARVRVLLEALPGRLIATPCYEQSLRADALRTLLAATTL